MGGGGGRGRMFATELRLFVTCPFPLLGPFGKPSKKTLGGQVLKVRENVQQENYFFALYNRAS